MSRVMRRLEVVVLGTLLGLFLLVAADWSVWTMRGRPQDHMVVTRMVVAPLKANREEYYPDGKEDAVCSRSLLPWSVDGACWRLRSRRFVVER